MLAWIDIETTGLDRSRDAILEVAVVITADDLAEVASCPVVLHQDEAVLDAMEDAVREMHALNGLTEEVRVSRLSVPAACDELVAFVERHLEDPSTSPLCGSNIGFDRGFLQQWMPALEGLFHYRNIDVSSVKELARRWRPDVYESRPVPAKAHRALGDIRESVAELRWYRDGGFLTAA